MRSVADWEPLAVKFDNVIDVLVMVRFKDFDSIADSFVVDEALLDAAFILLFVWESKSATQFAIFNIGYEYNY